MDQYYLLYFYCPACGRITIYIRTMEPAEISPGFCETGSCSNLKCKHETVCIGLVPVDIFEMGKEFGWTIDPKDPNYLIPHHAPGGLVTNAGTTVFTELLAAHKREKG